MKKCEKLTDTQAADFILYSVQHSDVMPKHYELHIVLQHLLHVFHTCWDLRGLPWARGLGTGNCSFAKKNTIHQLK